MHAAAVTGTALGLQECLVTKHLSFVCHHSSALMHAAAVTGTALGLQECLVTKHLSFVCHHSSALMHAAAVTGTALGLQECLVTKHLSLFGLASESLEAESPESRVPNPESGIRTQADWRTVS